MSKLEAPSRALFPFEAESFQSLKLAGRFLLSRIREQSKRDLIREPKMDPPTFVSYSNNTNECEDVENMGLTEGSSSSDTSTIASMSPAKTLGDDCEYHHIAQGPIQGVMDLASDKPCYSGINVVYVREHDSRNWRYDG